MVAFVDLTGKRFGRLTVVKRASNDKRNQTRWECLCDCGNKRVVYAYNLKNGHSTSCGCLSAEKRIESRTTHRMTQTRLYKIWAKMKGRCFCQTDERYLDYGGRGISVCKEWMVFEPFYEWAIANGYEDRLTIERVDNDGDYCPTNCRWATEREQANNTRKNRVIECFGESHTLAEWGRIFNILPITIAYRIKNGWSTEKALSTPVRGRKL